MGIRGPEPGRARSPGRVASPQAVTSGGGEWSCPSNLLRRPVCGTSLFAVRDPDEAAGRLDPTTGQFLSIESSPGLTTNPVYDEAVTPWAAGFGRLWIGATTTVVRTGAQQGTLTSYDLGSGQLLSTTALADAAGALAVDPASGIWAVELDAETLIHVDPATGEIITKTRLHHFPCCSSNTLGSGLAVGHGRIWVALQSP